MASNRSHDGVHETHCCWYYGCKYADDCPVVSGEINQAYSCEDCGKEGWSGIPPKELKKVDDIVGVWMERWFNDEEEAVAKEVYQQMDPESCFWFVAKLASCNRIGSVWKLVQIINKLEKEDR